MFIVRSADIGAYLTGSTIPKLSQGNLNQIKFIKPTDRILSCYGRAIEGMFSRIHLNDRESRTLAALRDTLLPKLLSGELRVADVDKYIQNVEGEPHTTSVIKSYLIVRPEGARQVSRPVLHYNLPAILAVGFRMRKTKAEKS